MKSKNFIWYSNPVTCSYSAGHDNQDRESTYNQSVDIWKGKCGVETQVNPVYWLMKERIFGHF